MDRFEQTIRRKDEQQQKKDKFKYKFFFAVAGIFCLNAIYSLITVFSVLGNPAKAITFFDVFPLILSIAIAIVCFLYKDEMILEYDYIIEDDTLIIAKIKNLNARKEVVNLPTSALKRIEKYNKEKLNAMNVKITNCSLNEDEKKYMLFYDRGEQGAIIFEPKDELLKLLTKELKK